MSTGTSFCSLFCVVTQLCITPSYLFSSSIVQYGLSFVKLAPEQYVLLHALLNALYGTTGVSTKLPLYYDMIYTMPAKDPSLSLKYQAPQKHWPTMDTSVSTAGPILSEGQKGEHKL